MKVERLPFDQYQRYRLVSDLLGTLRGKKKLEVLDVGGRTALLRGFLPKDHVTLVDLEASQEKDLVLGDGAKLPFRDKSFDVVAAFDTLEHVPPKLRTAFVAECARVSRGYVVLAGPYDSERVAEAEKILQKFLKEKLGEEHRYLEEHRHNGLPSRERTEQQLEELGAKVASFGHANLERWLAMMCLSLYLDQDPALRPLAERIHEFYNGALYASDHAGPVYRHVVVASLAGGPLPDVASVLDAPRAPAGALEPFTEVFGELAEFDRERAAWRLERSRLDQINQDLTRDLAGHSASLDEVERDLGLERQELSQLRELLESERSQATEAVGALEADLTLHRQALASLEQDLSRVRMEFATLERKYLEERYEVQASFEALEKERQLVEKAMEVFRKEAAAQELNRLALEAEIAREQEASRETVRTLEADLQEHKRVHDALRAEMEAVHATRAAEHEAARADQARLEREIEAHRQVETRLASEAEALREEGARVQGLFAKEREEAAATIAALRQEISAFQANTTTLEAELAREQQASREIARTLQADLASHKEVIATLRG
ncbi:MAG: methyltransferase domain-containing protein, partial [Planctomycetota bacterium]